MKISTLLSSVFPFECSDFVFTAYYVQQYIITTMFDDVLLILILSSLFFWCPCMCYDDWITVS